MFVQIYGRKKITLIPAQQVPWMYNDKSVYSAVDIQDYDVKRYPLLEKVTSMEVILEPGDAIFIPVGWWHSVENLDSAIALKFCDFNEVNAFTDGAYSE